MRNKETSDLDELEEVQKDFHHSVSAYLANPSMILLEKAASIRFACNRAIDALQDHEDKKSKQEVE